MSMKNKYYANRGIARNKKPLKNIMYQVEISSLKLGIDKTEYKKYKFKDLGYLILLWWYEGKESMKSWHGPITPAYLQELIGTKQYAKFCQGKRTFIIQRRIDGKNIPKSNNSKNSSLIK